MYSSSKTPPRRPRSGPSIELINGVDRFKTTFNPIISKQNKHILEAKMAVEKQSTAAMTDRMFNNNLYINYDKNPFNYFKNKKHQFSNSLSYYSNNPPPGLEKPTRGKKLSQIPKEVTIMDEISELQTQNLRTHTEKRIKKFQRVDRILNQASKTSNLILSQLDKSKQRNQAKSLLQIKLKRPQNKQHKSPKQTKQQKQQNKTKKQIIQSAENAEKQRIIQMSIDQIVGMYDTNHFMNEGRKKFNIFKAVDNDEQIKSTYEQLCQHKFSFDSVILKMNKIMIPILRQLSKFARTIMCSPKPNVNKVIDILQNQELSLKQNQIKFIDLMGLASGRLSSQLLVQLSSSGFNRAAQEDNDNSSVQDDEVWVPYQIGQSHFFSNFKGQSQQKKQIMEFQYIKPSAKQKKNKQSFSQIKTRIKTLLQSKQFNLSNHIYDYRLHEQTQKKIEQTFDKTKLNDIEKIVRKNKILKTKDQSFRLNTMIQVLKEKNQLDAYLNQNK